jgi:uncharacterized protein (TIGR00255 family)
LAVFDRGHSTIGTGRLPDYNGNAMRSMTGYGTATARAGAVTLSVEVRSVNQRHLDVKIVAPREYAAWEADLRQVVGSWISRGRVEVFVTRTAGTTRRAIVVNEAAAAASVAAWREFQRMFDLEGPVDLSLFQGRSEIFQTAGAEVDPKREEKVLRSVVVKALRAHRREREREGAHLARDINTQGKILASLVRRVGSRMTGLAPRLASRLEQKLSTLLEGRGVDSTRIAQEAAMLADRADVSEEIVRLQSHLGALAGLARAREPIGKRIEFLLQEINRELNTIGSKASDLEVTKFVLDGKAAVEKIREQVQNVE